MKKRTDRSPFHYIEEKLAAWTVWVVRRNIPQLGYAMSSYSERVGVSWVADTEIEDTSESVLLNEMITKKLPQVLAQVIWLHYIEPGMAKQKYGAGGKGAYYARLDMAKASLMELWEAAVAEAA